MLNEFKKKPLEFNFSKQSLKFYFSQKLFSSAKVDSGTSALLNSLRKNPKINYKKILDLGCGQGVMALFLKKQNPLSEVHAVDRDSLAIEVTKQNSKMNCLDVNVYASLDYQSVSEKFDLIVCNFPAKAGVKALKKFVYCASSHLSEGGTFSIVVVKELEEDFRKILNDLIQVECEFKLQGYFIFHLNFKDKISFDEDPYFRDHIKFKNHEMDVAYSVDEFESPSYSTETMVELMKKVKTINSINIYNPLQGHIALSSIDEIRPEEIVLTSRDLLSLEYSKKNLISSGFSNLKLVHSDNPNHKSDLLIYRPDKNETDKEIVSKIKDSQKLFPKIIISHRKIILERMIKNYGLNYSFKYEKKGYLSILIG